VLADEIAAPQENDIHYTEEVYRLPGCFFCFDYDEQTLPAVVPPPHLKEGYITFGCFGRSDKLNATNLMYWARILQSVPGSKLLLQNPGLSSPSVRQFFRSQFSAFGCGPERLILLPGGERADVLANYARVDISLDTWPYCGGNTIAESVYQGVPVITLKGSRFSSAYGASLVTACGTPELVANTPEELVQIAVELSADSAKLSALRQDLRRMVRQHGFGDSKRFAQNLDEAYLNMARQKGLIEERASMRSEVEALASEASRPLIAKSA
jgi:predicted O-linked N-acetylglucosamine transferase (SPINDLY family)